MSEDRPDLHEVAEQDGQPDQANILPVADRTSPANDATAQLAQSGGLDALARIHQRGSERVPAHFSHEARLVAGLLDELPRVMGEYADHLTDKAATAVRGYVDKALVATDKSTRQRDGARATLLQKAVAAGVINAGRAQRLAGVIWYGPRQDHVERQIIQAEGYQRHAKRKLDRAVRVTDKRGEPQARSTADLYAVAKWTGAAAGREAKWRVTHEAMSGRVDDLKVRERKLAGKRQSMRSVTDYVRGVRARTAVQASPNAAPGGVR